MFVHKDNSNRIVAFTRDNPSPYEWSNIALLHSDHFINENIYVYQCIERFLPVCAESIERLEIDTPADLSYALEIMRKMPKEFLI